MELLYAATGHRKRLTRATFALVAGMMTILLVLSHGGFVGVGSAQEASIRFLNPSISDTVTDRELGDHGFHLNAWVANAPENAVVEFVRNGSSIGTATRRGDTFEFFWQIPGAVEDGDHDVTARLFDQPPPGETLLAEDTVEITIEREAAGVRIDYPSNEDQQWGLFRAPGTAEFNGVVDVTFTSGTERVQVFYTTSVPGTEPDWESCATQQVGPFGEGAETTGQTRLRCDLDEGHGPENVTAVAAVAQVCTEDPLLGMCPLMQVLGFDDHSGDAHRVQPYEQIPSAVSLDVAGSTQIALPPDAGRCGPAITATVTDQNERPISRANVDVHATGPQETGGRLGLRFDTSNETDPNQEPDEGGHASQEARECDEEGNDDGADGAQGNHPRLGADTRHIESVHTGGNPRTDANGQFEFRLFNDEPGTTQITAWADRVDDDLFCSGEPAGHTSLGWNEPAPPVTGHEHDPGCPDATPTPPTPTEPPDNIVQRGPCAGHEKGSTQPNPDDPSGVGQIIVGTDGDDVLDGTEGDDIICGLAGDDLIRGGPGDDLIVGGAGDDDLRGGRGADVVRGNAGADVLRGGPGRDRLFGGRGPDVLMGGRGADRIFGGPGRDRLFGGHPPGRNFLHGGRGFDHCQGRPNTIFHRTCNVQRTV